jgi:hypothetical protein
MLRVVLGRARSDREWCINGSRAVGELKVSGVEFVSNPASTEAVSGGEGHIRMGRMMMSDVSDIPSMDSHSELEVSRDLEEKQSR